MRGVKPRILRTMRFDVDIRRKHAAAAPATHDAIICVVRFVRVDLVNLTSIVSSFESLPADPRICSDSLL